MYIYINYSSDINKTSEESLKIKTKPNRNMMVRLNQNNNNMTNSKFNSELYDEMCQEPQDEYQEDYKEEIMENYFCDYL